MGLVNVAAISEAQILPYVKEVSEKAPQEVARLREAIQKAEIEEGNAERAMNAARAKESEAEKLHGYGSPQARAAQDAWTAAMNAKSRAYGELVGARATARLQMEGAFYIMGLPNLVRGLTDGAAATKTDADGRFSLKLKSGRYAVVAITSRTVGGEQEFLYWFIWVDAGKEKRVILSNDNLMATNCQECVFKDVGVFQ